MRLGDVFMVLGVEIVGTNRMCRVSAFEGSAVFNLPTQEKPKHFTGTVRLVTTSPARSAGAGSVPLRPDPCVASGSDMGMRTAANAVLIAFMAWVALLFAGLGGPMGGVSQTLAGKLAAGAQHLQRHAGNSAVSRALRRELPAVATEVKVARASSAVFEPPTDFAVSEGGLPQLPVGQPSEVRAPAAPLPRIDARHRTPPSRAPPLLA